MATLTHERDQGQSFWARMAIGVSAFIVLGFAQFAMRGMVDYTRAPTVMHLHAIAMMAWLFLLVTQAFLAGRGGMALHRRLGWASAVLIPLIVMLASMTCLAALRIGLFPPFFTPAYFLALVHVSSVIFALTVAGAVALRGRPDWHRRLMTGSTVLLMEPALGRVLPMPFIMPWGEWLSMAIQLGVLALVVRHDRKELGIIHPATLVAALAVVASHVLTEVLALTPSWIAFAERIAAG